LPARATPSMMKVLAAKDHLGRYARWIGLAGTSNGRLTWALVQQSQAADEGGMVIN